ncbi:MAG: hypothetical protein ACI4IE_05335 [Eubacterium sp.]
MRCSKCGYEVNATPYCPNCGNPMTIPVNQNQNIAPGAPVNVPASQADESKQKTIRIAIISAAAVLLAIVIAVTSVIIYNSSITAVAAESVIYNDSDDDYCVVIKNSKNKIVSKEIIKPNNKYQLKDLEDGIYFVNMKSLNGKGDTIYFKKIKIVQDYQSEPVSLEITKDFEVTDDYEDDDFEDVESSEEAKELDIHSETVEKLVDKIEYAGYIYPTIFSNGSFESDELSNEMILAIAFGHLDYSSHKNENLFATNYDSVTEGKGYSACTDSKNEEEMIKYIFGDSIEYQLTDFDIYSEKDEYANFLGYNTLTYNTVYYKDGKITKYFGEGGGGDVPYIYLCLSSAQQKGDDISIYVDKAFVDTQYNENYNNYYFVHNYYKNYENGKFKNKITSLKDTDTYVFADEYGGNEDDIWYEGIYKYPVLSMEKYSDQMDCCCFTFSKDDDGEYYLTAFEKDAQKPKTEAPTTQTSVDEYDLYQTIIDDYAKKCNDANHSEFTGKCYICSYAYYDIDNNGIDELIFQDGTCEADRVHHVYTVKNNKAVSIGEYGAWHLALYDDNGKLVGVDGTGGIGNVYSIEIKGDTVKQTVTDTFKDGFPSYPNYIEFTTLE